MDADDDGSGRPGDRFKESDKNGDGALTEDEVGAEALGFLDGNKDGRATQEEARAAFEQMRAGQGDPFERFDKNKDGVLSGDEVGDRLARMDGNKDGKVTREEARQAFERRGGGEGGRPSPEDVFKRLDSNGDGKVTKDETADAPWMGEMMQKADGNKDGALTLDEAKAAMSQRGPGGPGAAGDRIVARAADQRIVARPAVERIIVRPAINRVVARPTVEGIVIGVTVKRVVAFAAGDRVVARAAVDGVVAGITVKRVVAATAVDRVVAGAADDRIGIAVAGERVVEGGPGQVLDVDESIVQTNVVNHTGASGFSLSWSDCGGSMATSSKTGGKPSSASASTVSRPPKHDTSNAPRMLTRSEIESLRRSKRAISARAKAELSVSR